MENNISDYNLRKNWIDDQIIKYKLENVYRIQLDHWNKLHNEVINCYNSGLDIATMICIDVAINAFFIQKLDEKETLKTKSQSDFGKIKRKSTRKLIEECYFLKDCVSLKKELIKFLEAKRHRIVHPIEPMAIWNLGKEYEGSYDNSKVTRYKTDDKTIEDFRKSTPLTTGELKMNLKEYAENGLNLYFRIIFAFMNQELWDPLIQIK